MRLGGGYTKVEKSFATSTKGVFGRHTEQGTVKETILFSVLVILTLGQTGGQSSKVKRQISDKGVTTIHKDASVLTLLMIYCTSVFACAQIMHIYTRYFGTNRLALKTQGKELHT